MQLIVTRKAKTVDSILGELALDGAFFCYTLENLELSIPCGTYNLNFYQSPHFSFIVPLLQDVPNRDHIEIHPGNTAKDFHGCIGVGQEKDTNAIYHSLAAFQPLMDQIQNQSDLSISIVEDYG